MEEYIEYLYQNDWPPPANYSLLEFLNVFAWFQEQWYQEELDQFNWINSIEQRFFGEWREGKEMHKVVITQKFYQTVEGSTKV